MAKRLQCRTLSSNASSARLQTRTTLRVENTARNKRMLVSCRFFHFDAEKTIAMRYRREKNASVQPRGIFLVCLSLESVWRPPELMALHDTRQVGIQDGNLVNSLLKAFYQLNPQHTPGATSGACHGTVVSNLVNLPSHLVGKLGDVALA